MRVIHTLDGPIAAADDPAPLTAAAHLTIMCAVGRPMMERLADYEW
jgi:hypothetical protein